VKWWSVQFGQFLLSCFSTHGTPLCPAICKSGGTCLRVLWSRRRWIHLFLFVGISLSLHCYLHSLQIQIIITLRHCWVFSIRYTSTYTGERLHLAVGGRIVRHMGGIWRDVLHVVYPQPYSNKHRQVSHVYNTCSVYMSVAHFAGCSTLWQKFIHFGCKYVSLTDKLNALTAFMFLEEDFSFFKPSWRYHYYVRIGWLCRHRPVYAKFPNFALKFQEIAENC